MLRLLIAIRVLFFTTLAQAVEPREFRFSDVCIALDRKKHELYTPGFALRSGSLFRLIPAPFATPKLTDAEDSQGIGLFYLSITDRSWTRRFEERYRAIPRD